MILVSSLLMELDNSVLLCDKQRLKSHKSGGERRNTYPNVFMTQTVVLFFASATEKRYLSFLSCSLIFIFTLVLSYKSKYFRC